MSQNREMYDSVVVGAGVAGLASASALSAAGAAVALVDRKPFVGGRAYSYRHPALDEIVDSQHILVGCCTNLRNLCAHAGASDAIRWYDRYTFLQPGGRASELILSDLPAPLHTAPSFARVGMLSLIDKVAIGRALPSFLRDYPRSDRESVADWLRRTNQPDGAIRHFWEPVLVGALNDTFERCSMRYAGQVFHETFLKSAEGGRFGIPAMPLSDFFGVVTRQAETEGTSLFLKHSALEVIQEGAVWRVRLDDGTDLRTRSVVVAVSFEHVQAVLGSNLFSRILPAGTGAFTHSPITTIHLWHDQPFTDLDHAVLLDTGIQWMFQKSKIRGWAREQGSYIELTISASHSQLREGREALLQRSMAELESFFPEAKHTGLRKAGVLKEAKATFSVTPNLDASRPSQRTVVPGLFLAGDWTATGWPSTMEGAARSGYLAAEGVSEQLGGSDHFVAPDLPPAGLMKFLVRQ